VEWWIQISPEVIRGVQSFGFQDPPPDRILEFVESYLSQHGDACAIDRWDKSPDDFFIYSHLFIEGGRTHTLEFVVNDTAKEMGVLKVVWVEHRPGDLV
jgi:hypothetical protein